MREKILKKAAEHDTLISPNAMEFLDEQEDPYSIIESLAEENNELPFPVGRDVLVSFVEEGEEEEDEPSREIDDEEIEREIEEEFEFPDIDVNDDISGNSTCTGEIDDFVGYFKDRYQKLKKILTRRRDSQGAMDIAAVRKRKGEGKIIGMAGDIHTTASGNKMLTLEDPTGRIRAFIKKGSDAFEKDLLEDEVVLAEGEVWKENENFDLTFNIKNLVRPGIPKIREERDHDFQGKIAFIGDVHMGSDTFLGDQWNSFLDWLKRGDNGAEEIRYLMITGDLIEGIGIYPNQEDELEIKDIYEQYREMAKTLEEIPSHIQVITIPGNHDIVRNPEPQPCLPEDVQEMFPSNVKFYGNPAFLEIDGFRVLLYHGRSINDLSDMLPQVDTDHPITAMKEMMKRRHLVPTYGKKTPVAPEEEDLLVIDELPDVFVTGHIHQTDVKNYHGVMMINSSTWQSQTEYQKMRDIQPEPGKVIVMDPSSKNVTVQNFD